MTPFSYFWKGLKHGHQASFPSTNSGDLIIALGIKQFDLTRTSLLGLLTSSHPHSFNIISIPSLHPILEHLAPLSQSLGSWTLFDMFGPLLNPEKPNCALLEVSEHESGIEMAENLNKWGFWTSWVLFRNTALMISVSLFLLKFATSFNVQISKEVFGNFEDFSILAYSLQECVGGYQMEAYDFWDNSEISW